MSIIEKIGQELEKEYTQVTFTNQFETTLNTDVYEFDVYCETMDEVYEFQIELVRNHFGLLVGWIIDSNGNDIGGINIKE